MKKMNSVSKLALALVLVWSTAGCDEFIDTRVEMDTFRQSQPLDDFESLEVHIEYDIGNLEISEGSDDELYSIDLEYDRLHFDPDLDFDGAGSRASLTFDLDSVGRGFSGDRFNNDLLLRLNPDIPIDLRLSTGVTESHLDLTGLGLTRLRLDGGVGRTEILFGELSAEEMDDLDVEAGVGDVTIRSIGNARVRDLKVEGGIGRTELDFSGEWDDWTTEARDLGRCRPHPPADSQGASGRDPQRQQLPFQHQRPRASNETTTATREISAMAGRESSSGSSPGSAPSRST